METCSCNRSVATQNVCQTTGSFQNTVPLSDDDDDEHVQVTPRRRVPLTTTNHDDSDLVVKGIFLATKWSK